MATQAGFFAFGAIMTGTIVGLLLKQPTLGLVGGMALGLCGAVALVISEGRKNRD